VKTLCYIKGQGYKPQLSCTDIGVNTLCYIKGQAYKPYLTLIEG
jgi:hypothetical protein